MAKYCSVKKNEDFADVHNFMRLAPAELIKKFEELENENYHSQARKIIVDWTTQHRAERAAKKNASGKSWMISVDKEYYSQSRGSALKSKGFTDAGGGGGSYEFDISGKSRSEVKDIVNQVFGSDSGSISIIDIGRFNVAKKNSVSDAERKVKEQADWKSKVEEIIAGVVKDFRMDENDEKELREKLGIKKNSGNITKGSIVMLAPGRRDKGEGDEKYRVTEDNGSRVVIEPVQSSMSITPSQTVAKTDVVLANAMPRKFCSKKSA